MILVMLKAAFAAWIIVRILQGWQFTLNQLIAAAVLLIALEIITDIAEYIKARKGR